MGHADLISPEWRALNRQLHEERADFGSKIVKRRLRALATILGREHYASVLDYGCGKGRLRRRIGPIVRNYDPAMPQWSGEPEPADLVVCWDVLEHIEPERLDAVLDHLRSLTLKQAFLIVATRPDGSKLMPDGRNPHLIIEDAEWWLPKLSARWRVKSGRFTEGELEVRCFV